MIALEVFGCSGGMAEGFRRAGLAFSWAFDRDPDACASYEANIGHRPIQIDVRDLVRMSAAGWSPGGPVDLLVADPPCAMWSRAGKKLGLEDERDLLRETCELIRHFRPAHFLVGNIPGLDDAPALSALRRTIGSLSRLGYCVDYASLNAASYGVPQHRHRPFWFGHLDGVCIKWPAPTHGDPAGTTAAHLPGMAPLLPWVTCREALQHLPVEEIGRPVKLRQRACNGGQHGSVADRPAQTVGTSNLSDGNVLLTLSTPAKRPPSTKGCQSARLGSPDAPGRTLDARVGRAGSGDAAVLSWPWDRPSTVVTSRAGLAPPGHHDESFAVMSLPDAIVLSEKAAAILQGFPETWVFKGATQKARWGMIGQAVPPPLAHAVARSVVAAMGGAS